MFHTSDFLRPNVLELNLDAFDRQQKPVDSVILFEHIRAEDQVQRPLTCVAHGQTRPWVLLIRFDVAMKSPILEKGDISQVYCLLDEAKVSGTII